MIPDVKCVSAVEMNYLNTIKYRISTMKKHIDIRIIPNNVLDGIYLAMRGSLMRDPMYRVITQDRLLLLDAEIKNRYLYDNVCELVEIHG